MDNDYSLIEETQSDDSETPLETAGENPPRYVDFWSKNSFSISRSSVLRYSGHLMALRPDYSVWNLFNIVRRRIGVQKRGEHFITVIHKKKDKLQRALINPETTDRTSSMRTLMHKHLKSCNAHPLHSLTESIPCLRVFMD